MNPTHLKTFLAVAKHLNYTRAGEELYLSQPAVSRQIQQLEADLGLALFERIGGSVHLTMAGEVLAPEAEKVLGGIERARERVQRLRTPGQGRLRIGASTTPGLYVLPGVVGRFHRRFPKVELEYTVANSAAIGRRLLRNELELGFVGAELTDPELRVTPAYFDEIVCFAATGHPLAKRRRIDPRALARETWVVRERGSATRELFESWYAGLGLEPGRTIELRSAEAVKALVGAGVGFSYMSRRGLRAELDKRQVKVLAVTGMKLRRSIYTVQHRDKITSPLIAEFLKLMRTVIVERR